MLTEKQIHDAASAIDAKGIKPTHRLVYDLLQTGSYTTIAKYLRSWKPLEEIEVPAAPDEVGRSVAAFATDVWHSAYASAEIVANQKCEALNAEILALKSDIGGVTAAADSYAAEHTALQKSVADGIARLEQANAHVAELKLALAAAEAETETWRRASRDQQRTRPAPKRRRKPQKKPAAAPSNGPPPAA